VQRKVKQKSVKEIAVQKRGKMKSVAGRKAVTGKSSDPRVGKSSDHRASSASRIAITKTNAIVRADQSSVAVSADRIAPQLSRWFDRIARDLPWRRNPQPYPVWLSEVMLQQTQVTAVIPYFNRFMEKFPTVGDLARASIDEVYVLWAGLGYYSRARNLHRGAQAMQARIEAGLGFPQNRAEWLAIPGVGEYTAGAICSIALNQREAIVDGNVVRVLSRIHAIGELDAKKTAIWERAREVVAVAGVQPRSVNQALMELGALVCKPKNPWCGECPVSGECLAFRLGEVSMYPPAKPKKNWKQVSEEKWVLVHAGKVLLLKNEEARWRQGLWDFPAPDFARVGRARLLKEETTRYVVTTHKIERKHLVFEVSASVAAQLVGPSKTGAQWFGAKELPGVPAPVKKFLAKLFVVL
jgi:A/G-specific adenine glycosylase